MTLEDEYLDEVHRAGYIARRLDDEGALPFSNPKSHAYATALAADLEAVAVQLKTLLKEGADRSLRIEDESDERRAQEIERRVKGGGGDRG